jgi:hypothetical protein
MTNPIIAMIATKADELIALGDLVVQVWEEAGWPDDRPDRTETVIEDMYPSIANILADQGQAEIPAKARITEELRERYDNWYSACLGLVTANMSIRASEVMEANKSASRILDGDYFILQSQLELARCIKRVNAIVGSIPKYLDARMHDMELAVATAYINDELNEANVLLRAGYVRCAGAMAGVLLERHLKVLCGRQQPPLKYGKHDGIAKLNDKLRDAHVYDQTQWRRIQWMGDIRNDCDHPGSAEPSKDSVTDLIEGVRKFIALA